MRRAQRWSSVLLLIVSVAFASALEVPVDAELLVTDQASRIVGVGRVVAGARFELVLEEGFAGPAVVVWLTPDGGVRMTAVVVVDAAVWVDGVELTSLLPETFEEVRVRVAKELGDALPPDVGQGPPDAAPAAGPAAGRDAPDGGDPPTPPGGPHGPPDDGPPQADPPGRPENAPDRRP